MDLRSTFIVILASCLVFTVGCASKLSRINSNKLSLMTDSANSVDMQFGMARMAERNDRLDQAFETYLKIVAAHPDHTDSLHRLGIIASKNGKFEQATQFFNRAMANGNPSAELLGDVGYSQYLARDLDLAADTFRRALALAPHNKRNSNNLAIVLGMQKRYQQSLDQFRQAGSEAESIAGLAFVQSQTGQADEAKVSYHRALELDSALDVAANGLVELNRASQYGDSITRNPGLIKTGVAGQRDSIMQRSASPKFATVTDIPRKSSRFASQQAIKPESPLVVSVADVVPTKIEKAATNLVASVTPTSAEQILTPVITKVPELAAPEMALASNVVNEVLPAANRRSFLQPLVPADAETEKEVAKSKVAEPTIEVENQALNSRSTASEKMLEPVNDEPGFIANAVSQADQAPARAPARAPYMDARGLLNNGGSINSVIQQTGSVAKANGRDLDTMVQQVNFESEIKSLQSNGNAITKPEKVIVRIVAPILTTTKREVDFQVEVTNNTSEKATDILVQLDIPTELRLTVLDRDSWANKMATKFRWKVPALAAGKTETIRFKGIASSAGDHRQEVKIFVRGKECDATRAIIRFQESPQPK